jgi:hypothetical protein
MEIPPGRNLIVDHEQRTGALQHAHVSAGFKAGNGKRNTQKKPGSEEACPHAGFLNSNLANWPILHPTIQFLSNQDSFKRSAY